MPKKPKEIKGVCEWFCETGIGPVWAFQENKYITKDSIGREQWSYEGLHILEEGDYLIIYHPVDPDEIMWEGTISATSVLLNKLGFASALNHPKNLNIDVNKWERFFMRHYPAILIPKSQLKK
jgi:hypothetical protein